jgi:hypothetical protein
MSRNGDEARPTSEAVDDVQVPSPRVNISMLRVLPLSFDHPNMQATLDRKIRVSDASKPSAGQSAP